jgi:hypothetical protein
VPSIPARTPAPPWTTAPLWVDGMSYELEEDTPGMYSTSNVMRYSPALPNAPGSRLCILTVADSVHFFNSWRRKVDMLMCHCKRFNLTLFAYAAEMEVIVRRGKQAVEELGAARGMAVTH